MKKIIYSLLIIATSFYACDKKKESNFVFNPPVPLADPHIMLHNNTYYAYGTNSADGIEVYSSTDLEYWKKADQLALKGEDSWGATAKLFWAPEVYYIQSKNKFFMYYSSNERVCVATSDSPLGPFKQESVRPMISGEKTIDNTLFINDDGKAYMYFDRFNDGNNIWVVELESDLQTVKMATMTKCFAVSQPWEEIAPRVVEAPYVIKHKNIYYMAYSANNYQSHFYGIGYATATSPMGPWTKYAGNPIFQKPKHLVGVGHNAIFKDKEGKLKSVFHAHRSATFIHPRDMYVTDVSFTEDATPVMKMSEDAVRAKLQK